MPFLSSLLAVAILLLPLSARAEDASPMQRYILSVKRLYSDLEYEAALKQLERARRFASTVEENVTLSLYEGIVLADMNRWEESATAFQSALFLQLDAVLPVKVSPKVEGYFESQRKKVKRDIELAQKAAEPSKSLLPRQDAAPPPAANQPVPVPAAALPVTPSPGTGRQLTRPQVLIPAIGGGVLLIAGGTSWMLSRQELSKLREHDKSITNRDDLRRTASRGSTYQTVGVGLLGAGLVGLGTATVLFFNQSPDQAAIGISTNGTSASVHGRWP